MTATSLGYQAPVVPAMEAEQTLPRVDWALLGTGMAVFAAMSIWMAVASPGFLEADGITHYLARRFALGEPFHMVGIWSRPACVLLYCVPAYLGGLIATRLMSLVLVLLMAWLVVDVARRLRFARPELAGLFLLTQPLLFAHSFSELTEVPFALLLLVMYVAYQRRWFGLLAVLAAFAPAARPEGFGLLAVVALALICHRRFAWLLVLPAGLLFWSYAGWRVYGSPAAYPWWRWLTVNWPYSPQSMYGHGQAYYFLGILPAVVGPIAFPFVWLGVWQCLKTQSVRRFFLDHDRRCRLLIAAIPLGVLVGHSTLWAMGKMASNGEPRYMLVVAPFWALLAAWGWNAVRAMIPLLTPGRLAIVAGLAPVLANAVYPCFPLGAQIDDRLAVRTNAWLATQPGLRDRFPRMAAALPHVFLQLDVDRLDTGKMVDSSRTTVVCPPPGILFLWDDVYSTHNSNEEYCVTRAQLETSGWRPIHRIEEQGREMIIYHSPLDKDGLLPPPAQNETGALKPMSDFAVGMK